VTTITDNFLHGGRILHARCEVANRIVKIDALVAALATSGNPNTEYGAPPPGGGGESPPWGGAPQTHWGGGFYIFEQRRMSQLAPRPTGAGGDFRARKASLKSHIFIIFFIFLYSRIDLCPSEVRQR